jgi:hypothetical protein
MTVPIGREPIWQAFFALLSGLSPATFATVGRRAIPFTQVPAGSQPALYVLERHEAAEAKNRGLPTLWRLKAQLYLYAQNQPNVAGDNLGGGSVLNPLLDAVEGALAPQAVQGNVQSLGGLVSRAFIDGEVEVDEGNIDGQAVAIIPVTIIGPV